MKKSRPSSVARFRVYSKFVCAANGICLFRLQLPCQQFKKHWFLILIIASSILTNLNGNIKRYSVFKFIIGYFGHYSRNQVKIFKCVFLSSYWSKLKNFCAHQIENFLRNPKLTLMLFLVPFLWEL